MVWRNAMTHKTDWQRRVDAFLRYRSALGYGITAYQVYLPKFAAYADARHADFLTVELASNWLLTIEEDDLRERVATEMRVFGRFCKKSEPRTEVLPLHKFREHRRRKVPHIFTELELAELQQAAAGLRPENGLRPSTYRAFFGLLASSGLRTAEAIRLTRDDVDLKEGVLCVRQGKRKKSRFVPLHPTATAALKRYAKKRDEIFQTPWCDRFFVTDRGNALGREAPDRALRYLTKRLHWKVRGDYKAHRCRDLRHTFIVRNIMKRLKRAQEFGQFSLTLATYVGHEKIKNTYWYMTGIPELMAIAGRRFHQYAKEVL
jgi:integrase/recombinase XerD